VSPRDDGLDFASRLETLDTTPSITVHTYLRKSNTKITLSPTHHLPLMESVASSSSSSDPPTKKPFPFFELPSELRIKIYQYVLFIEHGKGVVDLDRDNDRRIAPRLTCFRASRRMHGEAYPIFYGSPQQPFRLFPTGINELYRAKKPLLGLLTPTYRAVVNTIELRLGPAWEKVSPV
jgi:hypothetical protein